MNCACGLESGQLSWRAEESGRGSLGKRRRARMIRWSVPERGYGRFPMWELLGRATAVYVSARGDSSRGGYKVVASQWNGRQF